MNGPATPEWALLEVERYKGGVVLLRLDRPEVRNALNPTVIRELTEAVVLFGQRPDTRALVVTGTDPVFCAGADLPWMSSTVHASVAENLEDSKQFDRMLRALYDCPVPVVARVNGHAMGGGLGLLACADVVVASRAARFGFSEVRLGLAPAVVSVYCAGRGNRRDIERLSLTGEQFNAETAQQIGLVDIVCDPDSIDKAVDRIVHDLRLGGSAAQRTIKQLLRQLRAASTLDEAAWAATETFAQMRVSEEAQEGMRAFLEHRAPAWREADLA